MKQEGKQAARGILIAACNGADGLFEQLPESTLVPLVDRAVVVRAVEMLSALGCQRLDIVLHDKPELVRQLLGDGTRFGCGIVYHYCRDGASPLDPVWLISGEPDDYLWIGSDQALPSLASLGSLAPGNATDQQGAVLVFGEGDRKDQWTGWGCISLRYLRALTVRRASRPVLNALVSQASPLARIRAAQAWDVSTARSLLASQARFLMYPDAPVDIGVPEKSRGIWLSPKATIHPSAILKAPAFIGQNCIVEAGSIIGPNAAILDNSVVSKNCKVADALILPATYIGEDLDVRHSIVASDLYLNFALEAAIEIRDPGLIAPLDGTDRKCARIPVWHRVSSAVLWLALSPIFLLDRLQGAPLSATPVSLDEVKNALFRPGGTRWRQHFERVFLPGLRAIIAGRLRLTGLELRNPAEIGALDANWRALHRRCPMGVVSESLFLGEDGLARDVRRIADFYAAAHSDFSTTLRLLWRYGKHVVRELWHGGEPVPTGTEYRDNEPRRHHAT